MHACCVRWARDAAIAPLGAGYGRLQSCASPRICLVNGLGHTFEQRVVALGSGDWECLCQVASFIEIDLVGLKAILTTVPVLRLDRKAMLVDSLQRQLGPVIQASGLKAAARVDTCLLFYCVWNRIMGCTHAVCSDKQTCMQSFLQLLPYVLAVDDYGAAQAIGARVSDRQRATRWRRGCAVAQSVVFAVVASGVRVEGGL